MGIVQKNIKICGLKYFFKVTSAFLVEVAFLLSSEVSIYPGRTDSMEVTKG